MRIGNLIFVLILGFFVGSCASKGPKNFYFGNYSEAEHHYNEQEYENAIAKYKTYVEENPEGNLAIIAQYYIGKSYVALGEVSEAKVYFRKIVDSHPDVVWAGFSRNQLKELEKIQ